MDNIITSETPSDSNISETEYIEVYEVCIHLIDTIILNDPHIYSNPNFNTIIYNSLYELLLVQFEDININDDIINYIIKISLSYYFSYFNPRRSYKDSFILKKPNIDIIKNKINFLKNIPQPEQRTTEWYLFRYNLLTASNIWKAYGSEKTQNQLIYEKCKPINLDKYNYVNMESSLHWGQKYEPISIEWYEHKYNTSITDFGCIPHPKITYIGASPDGINTDATSDRYGRMLEVKNIVNREITGIPKKEYWIQMQIQMEVCNLNECDFLETRFIEYDNYDTFVNDGTFNNSATNNTKGIIICFIQNVKPLYFYAPLYMSKEEYELWEQKIMDENKEFVWLKNIYWKLDEISCVLVLRNKCWFNYTKDKLGIIWDNIIYDRINGYEHRAPTRNKKKSDTIKKCNIILEFDNQVETSGVETSGVETSGVETSGIETSGVETSGIETSINSTNKVIIIDV